ncbi:MAG: aldo/keto reductase [Hyphomonadaceae bacterium]|nr:aldo/keto reductase [Hyphomonadaceae bacterium]MBC6412198.1 aldo/keto reductase [Hyphomonadaceae bacterium]
MPFRHRQISGRNLSPIGLGCMSLSHAYSPRPDEADSLKLLNLAIDTGYNHFDSARLYGLGHNEALISEILASRRDEMFITSKGGVEFDDGKRRIDCHPEAIRRAVDKSLQTFGVNHIDLYYLHRRDVNTPVEESVGALADLRKEGKIGGVGLSEMSAATLRKAAAQTRIDAMQSEYSLWTRNPELGVLDACKETGTAFVAFSPVARGALADRIQDPADLPDDDLRKKQPRFSEDNWPKNKSLIDRFNRLAGEAGVSPAQLSLYWILSRGDHVHAIPGTGSIDHMKENFATSGLFVSADILDRADKLINQSSVAGHRYPEGVRKAIDTEDFE